MNNTLLSYLKNNLLFKDKSVRELIKPGLIFSFLLINGYILTARIMEGQWESDPVNLVLSQFFLSVMCSSIWLAIIAILHEPKISKQWQKIVLSFISSGLISVLFYYSFHLIAEDYPLKPLTTYPFYWALFRLFNRGLAICLFFYPLAYFYVKQKELMDSRLQIEAVKNAQLTDQIKLLQQQMTPHFLFNSLNVLKSGNNDKWTKKYIVELSNIIRHQLYNTSHKQSLISVTQELQLVESYIYLLKERFDGALEISIQLTEQGKQSKFPPYTLQTLVENALNYNLMSREKPLYIEVFDEQDCLVVRNNYQPRQDINTMQQTALSVAFKNIQERYQLLTDRLMVITRHNNSFIVKAPLIAESLVPEDIS